MTKQEVIKQSYGIYYKESSIDLFTGIFMASNPETDKPEQNGFNLDQVDLIGLSWRPKSLIGIENNNGWIIIESEDDLPKESCTIWILEIDNTEPQIIKFTDSFFTPIHKTCTHYQPITKPKTPIY